MRITAAAVSNFKRIDHVEVTPDADRVLLLIGGKNAQGKSSLLDALTAAFGGKSALPSDPVRHGAETAEIRVELDGGALTVRRTIRGDGESVLEVRDPEGRVRAPQQVLDKLLGARMLDPLAFLQLPAADQRKALLDIIADARTLTTIEERRRKAYERRTEVGRDLKKAESELERLPEIAVPATVDVVEVSREYNDLRDRMRHRDTAFARAREKRQYAEKLNAEVLAKLQELESLQAKQEAAELAASDAEVVAVQLPETAASELTTLESRMHEAARLNEEVATKKAAAERRRRVAVDVQQLTTLSVDLTGIVAHAEAEKAALLEAAKLPVTGLGLGDGCVTLNGVPLAQASSAEQLRVALALAIAAAPSLHDVWIRDGALLDDDSLAELAREAEAAGVRCWIERVGDRDPGAIVIHDGKVREEAKRAAG